jgi:two-component system alkaline phosphatase synthesis response regulator PhoP
VSGGHRLLLVEDEPSLVLTLGDRLRAEGYSVEHAGDGERALELAERERFDLVLLDVALPRRDGFEVCQELRRRGHAEPILMLTARTQVIDRVVGLKLGADDYLTKPFDMAELLARIEALLRRVGRGGLRTEEALTLGELQIDFRGAEIHRAGVRTALSALELRLLRYLVDHSHEVLGRDRLLDEVWGYDSGVYSRTVDVHIAALRQKIEANPKAPRHILTVHGMGYKFVP